jgi:hypothetical protein
MESPLFFTDLLTVYEPSTGRDTALRCPRTGRRAVPTPQRFMESPLFFTDLLTVHEPAERSLTPSLSHPIRRADAPSQRVGEGARQGG